MEEDEEMKCPKCDAEMPIDSVRQHKDGRKRLYWECKDCNLNVMWREENSKV